MKLVKADMHIHTCLSPCAEVSISPMRIVEKAFASGLNLIFITDHNSMENAEAAMKASSKYPDLNVYPGMEITSREEVHTLALFGKIEDAAQAQKVIYEHLPDAVNEHEYKQQVIANEHDEVEGFCHKSLFSAAGLSLEEIVRIIHRNKGLAVAAHIDREYFSVLSQLGFIPEELRFDALEVSPNSAGDTAGAMFPELSGKYKFITGSDSHDLENFGKCFTEFTAEGNSFDDFIEYIQSPG